MLCSFNFFVLSATKQQVFVAYLSQRFADNSYVQVTVQLSVLLIYEFLSVQVYFLSTAHNVQPAAMA